MPSKGYGKGGQGGTGKKNSIGSQVGKALGGHLSSMGKGPSGGGNSIFNSIKSWLGGPAYAHNMGQITGKLKSLDSVPSDWKVKQFADKNIDITKLNPSFQVNISTQRAIDNVKDEKTRAWLNNVLPQKVKDWRIDHQMYSPTKVMPGDDGYNVTGTGTPTLDPDTERYLDWAARTNPSGMTVADAEKLYANQIKGGSTLERAMRLNPAETGSFYALLPSNKEAEPTPEPEPKPTMDLNKIYNELLGRDVGQEGRDYWGGKFDSGQMSIQNIRDSIKQSTEYKGKQSNTIQLTSPSYIPTPTPTATSAPSRSIVNPYATDPNYTTTAPTSGDPQQQFKAGGNTYYRTGGNQTTIKADLDPVYSGYQGALETAYDRTVPSYTGTYEKDSKHGRSFENVYHQNILDELTRYAQQSGIGNFAVSDTSKPQWMPVAGHDNRSSEHYRNQASRATEDLWQQGQISDLESWAQSVVDSGTYADLGFNPSEVYHGYGKDGTTYSEHTNEGMRRNKAQSTGIESLVNFISQLDTARGPELSAEKDRLSGIYGAEIDRTYNELFETDTGIDQAGKDYWTKDLIENRPGLAKGQNWQNWLSDAFKNTHSYKDYIVSKGPDVLPIEGAPDNNSGTLPSVAPTFQQDLDVEKGNWGIGNYDSVQSDPWADAMQEFTSSYTSQINDLKKAFQESTRSNEKMLKSYQDQVAGYRKDLQAQAAYGERPMNQTVKGVKTRNELPGYKPKTGGSTGHFSRTGSRLSTQSLNVA